MSGKPKDLESWVADFANEVAELLSAVFDHAPTVLVKRHEDKLVVTTDQFVPLFAPDSVEVGKLDISLLCQIDASKQYLAVKNSYIKLLSNRDRAPIIRWDYERDAHSKPSAHIQVHGHRGALSHLLSRTGHGAPHSMESLHLPVGGARFRPCLEDVVEFLVRDCGIKAKPAWQEAVLAGRERWRRAQARTIVRDMAAEAADVLRRLGYTVVAPEQGDPPDSIKALTTW